MRESSSLEEEAGLWEKELLRLHKKLTDKVQIDRYRVNIQTGYLDVLWEYKQGNNM